jgi:integrase
MSPRSHAARRARPSSLSAYSSRCSPTRRSAGTSSTRASSASRRRGASSRRCGFLDWDEVEELAVNTVAPYGNLVLLAALTGLRQGELFALRDRNVDLDATTIQVEHGAYHGELVPVKTRASRRRVDLSSTAARVLRRQLLARKPNDLGLVFTSPRGEVLNDDNFRHRVFRPAVRRTGLTGLRFHDLRHTYAALMVRAGAHPKYLQAQMGHSSIKVTLDRYGHLLPDENRVVLEALDAIVKRTVDG